jgi:hypothetical protein
VNAWQRGFFGHSSRYQSVNVYPELSTAGFRIIEL